MPDPSLRVVVAHPSPDLYGADRMVLASLSALVGAGHRVTAVLPEGGPLVPHLQEAGAEVLIEPFPVLRKGLLRPGPLAKAALTSPSAVGRLRRLVGRLDADLVYVNTLTIPHWLAAARRAGRPAVCHVHEAEEDRGGAVAAALVAPLSLATAVFANSDHTARYLARHRHRQGVAPAVIPNGLDLPPLLPPRPIGEPARLLVVGRLNPRKGQDLAIDAVHLLRQQGRAVELHLAGDTFAGYEWVRDAYEDQVARLGLRGAVHFDGFRKDVWAAYGEADVVLVPSRVESLGNVAIEGLAARRPVVAARTGGLPEVVHDGETGLLVPPDDAQALATAVGRVLDDPHLAASLASAGAVDARLRFSIGRYGKELVAAVEEVARPSARRRGRRLRVAAVVVDHGLVGGLEGSLAHLAPDLDRQAVDLEAVVLAGPEPSLPVAEFLSRHVPTSRAPGARALLRTLRAADVVHVHAATALDWPAAVVAMARAAGVPVVLTIHLPGYPPPRPRRIGRARMQARFVARGALLRALGVDVRCPSARAAAVAARRFWPVPLAAGVLANGTPDPGWTPIGTQPSPLRAIFVGRLEARKRADLFIEAVALAATGAPVEGTVVGDGPERAALARLVEENEAPVRLAGAVADPSCLMAAADVLVLPSHAEGAPLVVTEAAACGRASVARASLEGMDAWRDAAVLVGGDAGPEEFAAVLVDLAADRYELRRRGAAARALYEQGHTSGLAAARFRRVYEDAARRRLGRRPR